MSFISTSNVGLQPCGVFITLHWGTLAIQLRRTSVPVTSSPWLVSCFSLLWVCLSPLRLLGRSESCWRVCTGTLWSAHLYHPCHRRHYLHCHPLSHCACFAAGAGGPCPLCHRCNRLPRAVAYPQGVRLHEGCRCQQGIGSGYQGLWGCLWINSVWKQYPEKPMALHKSPLHIKTY